MENICGFLVGCKIKDNLLYSEKLKEKIKEEIFDGNYIFAIYTDDNFNRPALEVCKQLRKKYDYIQILFTNNDKKLCDIKTVFYASEKNYHKTNKNIKYINILEEDPEDKPYNSEFYYPLNYFILK